MDKDKLYKSRESIQIDNTSVKDIYDEAILMHGYNDMIISEDLLYRWMVNCIRHNHTNYDETLGGFPNTEYHLYKNAVLDKISYHYPALKDECNRQKTKMIMVKRRNVNERKN